MKMSEKKAKKINKIIKYGSFTASLIGAIPVINNNETMTTLLTYIESNILLITFLTFLGVFISYSLWTFYSFMEKTQAENEVRDKKYKSDIEAISKEMDVKDGAVKLDIQMKLNNALADISRLQDGFNQLKKSNESNNLT